MSIFPPRSGKQLDADPKRRDANPSRSLRGTEQKHGRQPTADQEARGAKRHDMDAGRLRKARDSHASTSLWDAKLPCMHEGCKRTKPCGPNRQVQAAGGMTGRLKQSGVTFKANCKAYQQRRTGSSTTTAARTAAIMSCLEACGRRYQRENGERT